jgi:hypothetical protein
MRMERYRNILFCLGEAGEAVEIGRDWRKELRRIYDELVIEESGRTQQVATRGSNVTQPQHKKETGLQETDRFSEEYQQMLDDEFGKRL